MFFYLVNVISMMWWVHFFRKAKNIKDWIKFLETGALLIYRTGPPRNIKTQSLGTPGKTGEAFNPIRVLRIWVFSTVHRPLGLFRIAAKKGMSGQWQRTKAHLEKFKANAYKDYILYRATAQTVAVSVCLDYLENNTKDQWERLMILTLKLTFGHVTV